MTITTIDGVIAGMRPPEDILKAPVASLEAVGVLHSLAYEPGRPGAAVAPSPGMAGAALTTYAGQIPFVNPATGLSYLARLGAASTFAGSLMVYDRLWHNSGIVVTTTTGQTVNSVAWPARDRDGLTNGEGVQAGLEVSTATTNAGTITTIVISYTNQANVSGRTGTLPSFPITAVAGSFFPFTLQAGDTGVRSIQSITLGTSLVTGAVHLVAYRMLGSVDLPVASVGGSQDAVATGFPRLYDNTVPFMLWLPTSTSPPKILGSLTVSQG